MLFRSAWFVTCCLVSRWPVVVLLERPAEADPGQAVSGLVEGGCGELLLLFPPPPGSGEGRKERALGLPGTKKLLEPG